MDFLGHSQPFEILWALLSSKCIEHKLFMGKKIFSEPWPQISAKQGVILGGTLVVFYVKRNMGHEICRNHRGKDSFIWNIVTGFCCGNTECTSFTFPDPLSSWRLLSICTSKKTSRLFIFMLKLMLNDVSLCHMENLSLDLAVLMCRNFLYWHSVFPVAKRDTEASCLFLLSALFLLHSCWCCC